MTFRRTLLAAALAVAASGASAADLLAIYHDAQVSDPVYQSARAQYNASIEALPQARAGYLPLISGSASIFRNYVDQEIAGKLDYTTRTYAITLSQPIFRLQNWIAITEAEQQVLQAQATLASSQQDLVVRASQAYFDVLLAQDNVALSQAQERAIAEQLAQAKRNFEVGTATIVDTLEAQARYDQASAQEISDNNDLEVKRRALQVLIGKPTEGLTPLREPLELSPPQPNDIEAWVTSSVESSPAIANARANLEINRQEVGRQRAGHLPTLDLSATWQRTNDPSQVVPGILGPTTNVSSIGLVLGVPLYSGGLIQSRVRQALANRDRAEQDLENAQRTVAQNVRTNFLNVTSGIAQVHALERALASTQSQLDSTILGRDVGVRTSVDVLNAQQQVFQTRRDLQQARYNYLLSTLRLKSAAGTLTEDDVASVNRTLARG
ncbi:MAG TPA: TolC family outer membrane protein [Usitatibacter sp.]|jgi:outer membrane protein|nr:TolC family outer membrane protein [Usitatibacter sp.]